MNQKDLTQGPIFQTLFLFALPMMAGNVLQQTYNVVDTWVVGRFIGTEALAAVGSAYTLMTFLTSIFLGLCMGSGVIFSMAFGQKNQQRLEEGIRASFFLVGGISFWLTCLSLLFLDSILQWMRIPAAVYGLLREYLLLVFLGMPAVFLYNFFGTLLKALGNSVVPLIFLGIATGINIVLDLLFVAVCGWGCVGAAAATVLAQYLSGLGLSIYVLAGNPMVRQVFRRGRVRLSVIKEILSYSILTCLQQSVMNLGILMVQGLVNSFGTTVMAAFAAAVKVDAFAYLLAQEYANAFSSFLAQNHGAGETRRIRKGILYGTVTVISYCILVSLLMWRLAGPLLGIFIDASETAALAEGIRYLHIEGSFYWGIGGLFLLYGLYRALGKPGMSLILTIISLGTRVVLAYTLAAIPAIGVPGIWWSVPVGWMLADLTGVIYYQKHKRELYGA